MISEKCRFKRIQPRGKAKEMGPRDGIADRCRGLKCLSILGAKAIAGLVDVLAEVVDAGEKQTREQLRAVSPVTGWVLRGESKLGTRSSSRRNRFESRSVSTTIRRSLHSKGKLIRFTSHAPLHSLISFLLLSDIELQFNTRSILLLNTKRLGLQTQIIIISKHKLCFL